MDELTISHIDSLERGMYVWYDDEKHNVAVQLEAKKYDGWHAVWHVFDTVADARGYFQQVIDMLNEVENAEPTKVCVVCGGTPAIYTNTEDESIVRCHACMTKLAEAKYASGEWKRG